MCIKIKIKLNWYYYAFPIVACGYVGLFRDAVATCDVRETFRAKEQLEPKTNTIIYLWLWNWIEWQLPLKPLSMVDTTQWKGAKWIGDCVHACASSMSMSISMCCSVEWIIKHKEIEFSQKLIKSPPSNSNTFDLSQYPFFYVGSHLNSHRHLRASCTCTLPHNQHPSTSHSYVLIYTHWACLNWFM